MILFFKTAEITKSKISKCFVFQTYNNIYIFFFHQKKSLGPTVDGNYPLSITFYLPSSYINYFFNCKF